MDNELGSIREQFDAMSPRIKRLNLAMAQSDTSLPPPIKELVCIMLSRSLGLLVAFMLLCEFSIDPCVALL